MKEPNYKQKLIKKIDELLQQASDGYCAYCNHLEELKYNPTMFLDKEYTDRIYNLVKATDYLIQQVQLLLAILFEDKQVSMFELDAIDDLKKYQKNKRVALSYRKITEDTIHSFEIRTFYIFYNAKTGELEEIK